MSEANLPASQRRWSTEQTEVAVLKASSGFKTIRQIAEETGLPEHTISKWLKDPEFKEYIDSIVLEAANKMKSRGIYLITAAIEQIAQEAEESGDFKGLFKKKDLADLIQIRDELLRRNENVEQQGLMSQLEKLIQMGKERNTKVVEINPSEPKK